MSFFLFAHDLALADAVVFFYFLCNKVEEGGLLYFVLLSIRSRHSHSRVIHEIFALEKAFLSWVLLLVRVYSTVQLIHFIGFSHRFQ